MLRHSDIWRAMDRLAGEYGLSASGLARKAGLDPTTFNKSKRVSRNGKLRWPSTESVAKVLAATGASLGEFVSFVGESPGSGVYRPIPLMSFHQASHQAGREAEPEECFDDNGHPAGVAWDEIPFPDIGDTRVFALEVVGGGMEPVYRDGDTLIVSPEVGIRRGDRVVVATRGGEVSAHILRRRSARRIELRSFDPALDDRVLDVEEVRWMARIVWASQ